MPTSGSRSRSRAMRCSALRPCRPNASRSPADEPDLLVGADPPQTASPRREQDETGVARQLGGAGVLDATAVVELVELLGGDLELLHAGPAGVDALLVAVLLRLEAARRRLDPHREVLGHDRDVGALVGEVAGHREDARVVVAEPEAGGQRRGVGVVELDAQRAAVGADGDRLVEPTLADPQVVEQPQGLPGEVAELRVVALALELRDDDDGQHDLVLGEPQHRPRVGQEHGRVEDVRLVLGLAVAGRRARGGAGGGRGRLGRAGGVRRDLTGRTCHVPLPMAARVARLLAPEVPGGDHQRVAQGPALRPERLLHRWASWQRPTGVGRWVDGTTRDRHRWGLSGHRVVVSPQSSQCRLTAGRQGTGAEGVGGRARSPGLLMPRASDP